MGARTRAGVKGGRGVLGDCLELGEEEWVNMGAVSRIGADVKNGRGVSGRECGGWRAGKAG